MTRPPLIEVALRLTGKGFLPEDVTRATGLTATQTWRLGDPVQQTLIRRKHDGWVFGLSSREAHDMDELLRRLLDTIEPFKDKILHVATKLGLEREISFGVYLYGETPASWFAADTIRRVSALGASLDIDLILGAQS